MRFGKNVEGEGERRWDRWVDIFEVNDSEIRGIRRQSNG